MIWLGFQVVVDCQFPVDFALVGFVLSGMF